MGWRSGQTYSEDLRARVLAAVDRGGRVYEMVELFEVSVSYIYKALGRRRQTGIVTALPKCGRPGRKLDRHLDLLVAHVRAHPDATLAELVEWSAAERGVKVCIATMWATLEALGITLKKRPATPPSKSARTLRLLAVAAGVVFCGLLALFPAITALVSLYGSPALWFASPATINELLSMAVSLVPFGVRHLSRAGRRIAQKTAAEYSVLPFCLGLGAVERQRRSYWRFSPCCLRLSFLSALACCWGSSLHIPAFLPDMLPGL